MVITGYLILNALFGLVIVLADENKLDESMGEQGGVMLLFLPGVVSGVFFRKLLGR